MFPAHIRFVQHAADILKRDSSVIGLAVGGSWLTRQLDEYSDLDFVLITKHKIPGKDKMISYANRLGNLLQAFTGDHVGEPRLLICLFDEPLLHVDIKFLTLPELENRIENPEIIFDTDNQIAEVISTTKAEFPLPDFQWIEDRFWTWIHYTAGKIARGEFFEAIDTIGFLRSAVLGPLLHIKNNNLPRGVRKLETLSAGNVLQQLQKTVPAYNKISLLQSLHITIEIYRNLRNGLYNDIGHHTITEKKVLQYLEQLSA